MLPHGLHAVYKPAGVNCTLHAHYPSLVYPFLTRELPWRTGSGVVVADGCGRNRDAEASSSLASCVPVLRQQGLVNRVDVGTSGIVLVARASAALHGAVDAMIREHHMRKTYRALVQRWPPLSCSSSASTVPCGGAGAAVGPLFSVSPFLSPMVNAVVCAPVYAAGATAASICRRSALPLGHGSQLQSSESPRADASAVSRAGSAPPWSTNVPISPSSLTHVHQQYATLHASLQDQRNAITRYRVLEYFASAGVAYVHVELHSGRRHQIRQHFAQLGFPLVGDARYHPGVVAGHSGTTFGMQRAALHAYTIDILATTDGDGLANGEEVPDRVVVQAVLPADMHRALLELRQAERAKSRRQRWPPQQPRG
ncbi:RNA pseudouridylate synthase-like protein [Leishmania tarentolae]|uniref:RNA pseudouridylate synthase-like protein n=1 Tax=Leishmania tarentolae TaxID=5689 RepID=A0A640K8K2_LEITA|nr:RNA pseudouridylate synthase-like protein [Leishmania tarentolae]